MEQKTREALIDAIIDLAMDEYENKQDLVNLAKMSEHKLVMELINIAEYFREQSTN